MILSVLISATSVLTSAVDYTDLRPTYTETSDYWRYINTEDDDELQKRANCYGYAIRLHYNGAFWILLMLMDSCLGNLRIGVHPVLLMMICFLIIITQRYPYSAKLLKTVKN